MAYTSHADLGGTPGHGPVQPEPEHLRFHHPWEAGALAITLAMGATGQWNIDQSRAARETQPDYAELSYYQLWLAALAQLMVERGLVSAEELATGRALQPPRPVARVLHANEVAEVLARGSPSARAATAPPRFAPGDAVRTRATAPPHHSRIPGYARGQVGRVERHHGAHVFAEAAAQGLGERPEHLYTVVFDAEALWGTAAAAGSTVSIDAWESTLMPADSPALRAWQEPVGESTPPGEQARATSTNATTRP